MSFLCGPVGQCIIHLYFLLYAHKTNIQEFNLGVIFMWPSWTVYHSSLFSIALHLKQTFKNLIWVSFLCGPVGQCIIHLYFLLYAHKTNIQEFNLGVIFMWPSWTVYHSSLFSIALHIKQTFKNLIWVSFLCGPVGQCTIHLYFLLHTPKTNIHLGVIFMWPSWTVFHLYFLLHV